MKAEQAASLLGRTPLFAGLDESELLALGACAHRRIYRRGEYIFHQGDTGDAVFVLTEGRVKVIFASEEGDEMILATLQPPDVFGELALIDGGPRSASIQTLEPTTVLTLTRATLLDLMSRQPAVTDVVLRSLGRLVRRMIAQAGDLVFMGGTNDRYFRAFDARNGQKLWEYETGGATRPSYETWKGLPSFG